MAKKIILHLDMNSYFASVEQQANPFLRGRTVGVCSYLSPGGCIIASSPEAKARGIRTGCRVREAKELDPKVILVENEPAKYRSTTEKIFSILESYGGAVEPYSIDEAFIDLSGWVKNFHQAAALARAIQLRIKEEVGEWLSSSIGLAWTKFLAKFAGDIAPKKSILAIENSRELVELLRGRPLSDAWGINTRMEARLNLLGIKNLLDLKNYSQDKIRRALGRYGYYLWANLNGLEISHVNEGLAAPKLIGHSYCLPRQTTDKNYLSGVLYKLCEKTGRRLRQKELEAESLRLGWSYLSQGGYFKSFKTREKLFTTEEIFKRANQVLEKAELAGPVRLLAVSVGCLMSASNQLSFFQDNLARKDLSRALDKINDKFGEYTVMSGRMFGAKDLARDRIGFRKVE